MDTAEAPAGRLQKPAAPRRRRRARRIAAAIVGLLLALTLILGVGATLAASRYMPAIDDARALRTDLEAMIDRVRAAGMDIDAATIDALADDLSSARRRLDRLSALVADDPLVAVGRSLPMTAGNVHAADNLLVAGDRLLDAAETAVGTARRLVEIRESTGSDGESVLTRILELLTSTRGDLDVAMAAVADAGAALDAIPDDALPQIVSLRDAIESKLDEYLPRVDAVISGTERLPAILGWDAPRRYLVLAQDPAELRPTGGFAGTYAIVTFDRARIAELRFEEVGSIEVKDGYTFVAPPRSLSEYLLGESPWRFRDVNWSPDFPTTARDALRLYENETRDSRFDGVIGITTYTIDELLEINGPIEVPGFDTTVAAGETTATVLANTRVPRAEGEKAKAFLFEFVDRLLEQLLASPPDRWPALLDLAASLHERPLLRAWFTDPADQAAAVRFGIDGAVRDGPGDLVQVVDANVSPTSKLNMVTDRSLDLEVTLDETGSARHVLQATWNNHVASDEAAWYRGMLNIGSDVMGIYSRILVPRDSTLGEVSGTGLRPVSRPAMIDAEAGRSAVATYVQAPAGETTLDRTWTSPSVADIDSSGGAYHLSIPKQPGVPPEPLRLTIRVPAGATITEASEGLVIDGSVAVMDTTFDRDIAVMLRYQP